MKFDLLTPSQLPYPQLQTGGCQQVVIGGGASSYQSPPRTGLFNSIFTPDDLPYPLPILQRGYGDGSQTQCGCNSGTSASGDSSSGAGGASSGNAGASSGNTGTS